MTANSAATSSPERKVSVQPAGFLLSRFSLAVAPILLIMAAWAGQTVIVILLGLGLSAAVLAMWWSYFALKGVQAERQLIEQRAFPDGILELKLRVVNRKLLPLSWLQVSDEVPAGFTLEQSVEPGIRPGFERISRSASILWYSAASWKYQLVCKKRGYYPLGPLTVTTGDIFGFYPRTATETAKDHIIVYPKIFSLSDLTIPSLFMMGEAKSDQRIFEDPSRIVGVRDYRDGDSLKSIHWKASARQQQLQVKVFEPATSLRAAIFLAIDSFQENGAWNHADEELGISTAASLASALIEKKRQVSLYSNCKLADSGQPARIPLRSGVDQLMQILEALAKIVSIPSGSFADFFQIEMKSLPAGATLVFIFRQMPDRLKEILVDLAESGYKVLVIQVGHSENASIVPGIAWFNVQKPAEIVEIDNLCQD